MTEKTLRTLEYDIIRDRLARLTTSELSVKKARELVPSNDFATVSGTLQETDDAVALIMKRGRPPLGGLADVIPSVKRACGGSMLSFSELLAIAGVLRASRRTVNYCGEESGENVVVGMIRQLCEDYGLESEIARCIVSEDEMADEASPELSDIRRKIAREQANIKEKLNEFIHSQKYAKAIQDGVITMRGDRYCIPVKSEFRGEFPGLVHDMSGSGQTLFVEPAAVVDSNNKIRELKVKEAREIERITLLLGSLCAEKAEIIILDVKLLADVDFAFAKASLALEMKAQKPQINNRGYVKIVKGRHPMIESHKVVPISVYIGDGFTTLVVTGPNTGGKTVTLKTVGLFTLMMQAGLLVPCESTSELAVFEDVFADIGDEQSIAQSLSTFSAHMSNIVGIVNNANDKSLVLLDELGAGTDPTEGAALAMAILECLHQMGTRTVATTHYSELKAFTASTPGFENACCEFNVETLSPTYKLIIGIPGKSNAFAISEKLGLDSAIISRAGEFLSSEDVRFEDMLSDIEKKRAEIENSRREVEALTAEADRMRNEMAAERESFNAKKNELLKKAKEEAANVIAGAKKDANAMLSELRTLCRDADADNRSRLRSGEAIGKQLSELDRTAAENSMKAQTEPVEGETLKKDSIILPGQALYSESIAHEVEALKPIDREGNVYVQAGVMKMYLPYSDLKIVKKTEKKEENKPKKRSGDDITQLALSFKPEIDLRGMTGDEAVCATDRYLDTAKRCRAEVVTIIHGKGTGVLRKEIQNMLKKDRRVKEYRCGEYGEGDYGVTIVTLK